MNPLRTCFLLACLAAASFASPNLLQRSSNDLNKNMKPSEWLSPGKLDSLPALDEITMEQLERMSPEDGADLIDTMAHLAQIKHELTPTFVPSKSNIPAYIIKPNGKNISTTLDQLASAAENEPNFGDEELTVLLLGYPQETHSVRKATRQIVQNYMERYDAELKQKKKQQRFANNNDKSNRKNKNDSNSKENSSEENNSDSDEDYNDNNSNWNKNGRTPSGDLVVIDIPSACQTFGRLAKLDVEKTGKMIAQALVKLSEKCDVPEEVIHIVAQGPAAHVAGAAGRECARITGRKYRRITALDPSKLFTKNPEILTGLARGDADFVDAIHTTARGLGTENRVGDVDFFPNGPSAVVPGADNVVEAAMRATRYFAESVRPGNERNFPAVTANSLKQYKTKNGHGKRTYMGIACDYDLEGDFMLQVNAKAPFGKIAPAEKQAYHNTNQA